MFVAGLVKDLLVPSSVTGAPVVQLAGLAKAGVCSNIKPAVFADGHETVTLALEPKMDRDGRRSARAAKAAALPPAVVNSPPT